MEKLMQRYILKLDDQQKWVWGLKNKDEVWCHHAGITYVSNVSEKKQKRTHHKGSLETGEIKAPMPGKIIKVLGSISSGVEEGQTVIVMEAMKMEYSLSADMSGKVTDIFVIEGQQVNAGMLLAKISKENND